MKNGQLERNKRIFKNYFPSTKILYKNHVTSIILTNERTTIDFPSSDRATKLPSKIQNTLDATKL